MSKNRKEDLPSTPSKDPDEPLLTVVESQRLVNVVKRFTTEDRAFMSAGVSVCTTKPRGFFSVARVNSPVCA